MALPNKKSTSKNNKIQNFAVSNIPGPIDNNAVAYQPGTVILYEVTIIAYGLCFGYNFSDAWAFHHDQLALRFGLAVNHLA